MTSRLAGKTAFVTAAGAGIGRATALAFARHGARVIATDLNAALLDTLKAEAAGLPLSVQRLDVLDPAAITAAAQAAGPVNVLFNGAGFVHAGSVLDATEEEWSRLPAR
jgi:2-keto-3-deoxy-L-fuconate dehydrogenase